MPESLPPTIRIPDRRIKIDLRYRAGTDSSFFIVSTVDPGFGIQSVGLEEFGDV